MYDHPREAMLTRTGHSFDSNSPRENR